ncbi:unnamed protein product [Plutella xylostella]|uniref:(diamondback moth) hypothetical protein n=1 Tax=Plutella xylostella TaxID=51655 RepID=A0A8S4ESH4_PLUXY|nr:unnamed protein product [Plutella xylostella]
MFSFTHSEESGAESDEEKADNEDSPQWKLLETIRNHPGPDGSPMSTAFLKLPSRRFYPDYYKEIKNPVSLNQIRNKIRRGAYGTLSEVAGDMNIMFENAKQYNINTSKLYKNAVKLQRLMQQRVQELLELAQSSSSDDESLSSVKSQAQANTPRPRANNHPLLDIGISQGAPQHSVLGLPHPTTTGYPPKVVTPRPRCVCLFVLSTRELFYPNGRPRNNPLPPNASSPVHSPLMKHNLPLKKKLHAIAKYLLEYTCSDGRQPMLLFMEKPSKKLYPHYYNVIEKPIDMITIESNIKNKDLINVSRSSPQ